MARCAVGWRTAGAGSTTLPIGSLFATAGVRPRILEIGVFNTTATAVCIALKRATAVGTPGTGLTEGYETDESNAIVATAFDTHTVTGTFTATVRQCSLGAAIGSGMVWTFAGTGMVIPQGTGNGVVIIPGVGTGQICDCYIVWEE
jgi:hypothetical protein